jgi:hypothetical protein
MIESLDSHFRMVIKGIIEGRLVPFLGAGVNMIYRSSSDLFKPGKDLPNGNELAAYLAEEYGHSLNKANYRCQLCKSEVIGEQRGTLSRTIDYCPLCNSKIHPETLDLARVSQQIANVAGSGPLYDDLHKLFDCDYPTTPLHRFFARLPSFLRSKGYPYPYQLIVTTNYDDVLERAFSEADESFDLVYYVTDDKQRHGKFLHVSPDGEAYTILKPNKYRSLSPERRSVILKIHGSVDRTNSGKDSFVITEDHYIDYLTNTDLSSLMPVKLAAKLRNSHFLFLGYGLKDWNLRVILHRIWGEQRLTYKSWAIQLNPTPEETALWSKREVDILDASLDNYIVRLSESFSNAELSK